MSLVSAANDTDTADVDSSDTTIAKDIAQNTELITKKANDNVTKTSTSQTKTASKISVSSLTAEKGASVKLNAKVTNSKTGSAVTGGKVVFKINSNTVGYSTVTNGEASYTYDTSSLSPKKYVITAKYGETSQLLSSSKNSTLTVTKATSKIVVKNATVKSKGYVTLTALVTNKNNGVKANSGKVVFKVNGNTVGYANVSEGKAVYKYYANTVYKNYTLSATYGGNTYYKSSVSSNSVLKVTPRVAKITVSKVSGYSTSVILKATLVDSVTSNNINSGSVIFKVNDKTVGTVAVSKGSASLNYSTYKLARGTYKITVKYKATSYYTSSSSSNNLTIKAESSFTYDQIKAAAVNVRTQLEANNNVSTVHVSKSRIGLSDFLALMIQAADNVKKGKSSTKVPYKRYDALTTQTDTMTKGVLNISQILDVGKRTLTFMNNNNRPPKYSSTVLGNLGYYNIVYSYSKVLDVSTAKYLPSTCKVYNWASIHPSNPKKRIIYITSDRILSEEKDRTFMKSIKTALEKKGYTVVIAGYGSNTHNYIRQGRYPDNAVELALFGGADAGVIKDMCTRSFMRQKENRLMFLAYHPATSKDITGLSFLERAHDDNYSSSSFKGLSKPDNYLKNHGYDYVYSSDVNTIVKKLISYIS